VLLSAAEATVLDTDRQQKSFLTHANYIRAFSMLCRAPYTPKQILAVPNWERDLPVLARHARGLGELDPQSLPPPVIAQVQASLRNAWGTELLLALGGTLGADDELVRLMNNWAVVQAYYCCYHGTQALLAARGAKRPENHSKTQREFVSLWVSRKLHCPPWSFGAGARGWCNPPEKQSIDDKINSLSHPSRFNCWSLASKALRTTREERLSERIKEERNRKRTARKQAWEKEQREREGEGKKRLKQPEFGQPRLSAAEKAKVEERLRPFSLMDYLYRLRIKTNYKDAAMFTEGPEDEDASLRVHLALSFLTNCTLLVHELRIQRLVGEKLMLQWVDDWLGKSGPGAGGLGVARRRDLLVSS
jgi:hypothetical protein